MQPQDIKNLINLAIKNLQIDTKVSFGYSGFYGKEVQVTVTLSYEGEVIATSTDTGFCPD